MPAAPLPPALEEKLADLATDVRRLLLVRGAGWLAVLAFLSAALAVGLDAALDLPGWVRGLLLVGWLGLTAWGAARWVVGPLHKPVPPAELAALVERDFPGLAERLTTLVGLSEHAEPGNGSRALIATLARETAQRTRPLNFSRVAPTGSAVAVTVLAVVAALSVLTPLAVVSGAGDRVRRFVLPWYSPPVDVPYRVVVSSGDPVVKRGDPVTLTAYLERTRPDAPLPQSASLVVRPDRGSPEKKLPMTGDESAAFHLTMQAAADDFEYCVEVGPARSEWHAVAVADPVAPADGTTLMIAPPHYAAELFPEQGRDGFAEFDALQYSRVTLTLKLSRPATEASLEWRPADPKTQGGRTPVPLKLGDDRTAGTAEFTVPSDGTLLLTLTGAKGLRTEFPVAVRATPDAPPRFEKVTGVTAATRDARPDDRIPIELAAVDDLRLAELVIEYCVNGQEADLRTERIPLDLAGGRRAEGAFVFALAGKAKEGETIQFRLRARDNRAVPEFKLGPQAAVYPPNGWAALRLTADAKPLAEQEILAQRDKIREKLAAAAKLVREAQEQVEAVRVEPGDGPLPQEQAVRVRDARDKAAEAARTLDDLAADAGLTPDLRGLAADARAVSEGPLRTADTSLRSAAADPNRPARDKSLGTAAEKLSEALAKLGGLTDANDRAAQARLDREHLTRLAEEQKALAEKAEAADKADELARKQKDLLGRLDEVVNGSDQLRAATGTASADELRRLAQEARRLADEQAALNRAADRTDERARKQKAEDLARRQKDLAEKAAELAKRTGTAARLAGTTPTDHKPFDDALERLTRGQAVEALSEQEKAARELDRLADALARAAEARGDRKETARQLARWEDDLRRRLADATSQTPAEKLPPGDRQKLADEQMAIRDAVERLRTADAAGPTTAQDAASKETAAAADALARNPAGAAEAVRKAADALARLAEATPSAEQREKLARAALELLRKEQDAIARDADETVKGVDPRNQTDAARAVMAKKLAEVAARQEELAKKVRQLDTPRTARKETAAASADRAAADLRDALPLDVPVSQQQAKRDLDRLRQALDGLPTPDEQAADAARLQWQAAEAAAALPDRPNADDLRSLQQLQREATRQLAGLTAPDAPGPLADARDAAQAADKAVRDKAPVDELRKKTKDAAAAADRLATRTAGGESDQERVERLARERADQARQAKAETRPTDPDAAAEAARQAQKQLDELDQVRVGRAQAAKKRAAEALQRLRQAKDGDRQAALQKAAAEDLQSLAREMAKNGDRSAAPGPPKAVEWDDLRALDGGGHLPTKAEADAARRLAREQRALRDETAKAGADVARGARPAETDALAPLAKEQGDQAKAARGLASKVPADAPTKEAAGKAAAASEEAARHLRAGSVDAAIKSGTEGKGQLDRLGEGTSAEAKQARELAGKQAALNDRMAKLRGDPAAEAARQKDRQAELAAAADQLAQGLRTAALGREPDSPLGKAAEAAGKAKEKTGEAAREAASGRPAWEAREQAAARLVQTAEAAEVAARAGSPGATPTAADKSAGEAVREAEGLMRQAGDRLRKPDGAKAAAGTMRQAADALSRAAQAAGRTGRDRSGGNDGRPQTPPTDKLPAEVTQYLDRPWGELPGEVRSRIIQELVAKYGEDYARSIKLYFEQIASKK